MRGAFTGKVAFVTGASVVRLRSRSRGKEQM